MTIEILESKKLLKTRACKVYWQSIFGKKAAATILENRQQVNKKGLAITTFI